MWKGFVNLLIIIAILLITVIVLYAIFASAKSYIKPADLSAANIINILGEGFRSPVEFVTGIVQAIKNFIEGPMAHFSWWMFY